MKVVEEIGIGAGLVAASLFVPGGFLAASALLAGPSGLATILATAGAGLVLSGAGTLLSQKANGIASASRNPISPWQVAYGNTKVGGTVIYQQEVGSSNRLLLMVIAVACHECDSIRQIWLNNKPVTMEFDYQNADESNPNGFQQSFDPPQGNWQIETISRTNNVVSVTFAQNPNSHLSYFNGQTFHFHGTADSQGLASMDGNFPVVQTSDNTLTYTCGGAPGAGRSGVGTMTSTWPRYGNTVVAGYYLGDQTSVSGIILGNANGYWTEEYVARGITYVALKFIYNAGYYSGMPDIGFVINGKNDIYDPRTKTKGYTNNAALCIADYLAQPIWGFNAAYGDNPSPAPGQPIIPVAELIAAANICDEQVPLALGGTEPRYRCDGTFDVSVTRGDVLQNMLTSCCGRFIDMGGQFFIQPAAWVAPTGAITIGGCSSAPKMMMSSIGLVPEFFNSPANTYVPTCAGTSKSQAIYTLGMLQAFQATGNLNALALARMALAPILAVLFRGVPAPATVTSTDIWSPNWAFDVKQPFLGNANATISPAQDIASDFATPAGWRAMQGLEVQTNGDAYNWYIRLFGLAAQALDSTSSTVDPDLGYGLSPFGDTYGDPDAQITTTNSQWITYLNAIIQMARIAYQISFTNVAGNTLTILNPAYQGGAVPFAVEFLGAPAPKLNTWIGPYYTGYQSPYAILQANSPTDPRVATAVQFLASAQNQLAAMQTVADTVVFTVTGANPQTLSVPVQISVAGVANAVFQYPGHNVGTDTIVATLASHSLTSNAAEILWSAYSKPIAVYGAAIAVMAADGTGLFNSATAVLSTQGVLGLMFNAHPQSIFPGDPHSSGNTANPFVCNSSNSQGQYVADSPIGNTSGKFNAVITGGFSIAAAGNVTFQCYVNSAFVMGVQGATYVSGQQSFGALSGGTAVNHYPALVGLNTAGDWPGGNWAEIDFTLHFAAAGLYQFEIDYASGLHSERQFALKSSGAIIPVIGLAPAATATATGTAPSGQIQLTPYSGGAAIGSEATFFCSITGLSYTGPAAGPFAPVYYFAVPAGAQTWGPTDTWGWSGPDPNTIAGYYQYRPLVELCDLIGICAGTESYYSQAVTVATTFIGWIAGKWSSFTAGPPNSFPQTGAVTTAPDIHCAALILHAALALDLHARPTGAGTADASTLTCINEAYGMCITYYLSSGPMKGTFCLDPTGAQTWSPIWHGELLRSLSMLVQWCNVNGSSQNTVKANAITWINGLINFALNEVVVVSQDLGYTVNDLSGAMVWRPTPSRTDLYNGIKGSYISQANAWQQSDFPSYAQDAIHGYTNGTAAHQYDANWDADGQRLWKDVQLPFTTSVSAAQRIAKIELLRIRKGTGTVSGMMTMYQSAPLDVVFFSWAVWGWVNKLIEVQSVRLLQTKTAFGGQEVVVLSTELDIKESGGPGDYEWSTTEELSNSGYSYIPGLSNLSPD